MPAHELSRRCAGVLCHIASLPGPAGTLGSGAHAFLDFIGRAGLSVWQMLPLNPPDRHGSPYHSASLFALHTAFLDPRLGLNTDERLAAYTAYQADAYEKFTAEQAYWLNDYCQYEVASHKHGTDWSAWPAALRNRDGEALEAFDRAHHAELDRLRHAQFAIAHGFAALRREAASRGVQLFGDMPLYPAFDSADVWAHQELFQLNDQHQPRLVAGVPPDYFSSTGQLWGNPVYDWDAMVESGFVWWIERMKSQLRLFDVVRIDHFRGLDAYWAIPPGAPSAAAGSWQPAPGRALLGKFRECFDALPVVAEDLGDITPQVNALRDEFGLPGMRVAQFAFSGDPTNPHRPVNYVRNTVAYTGTHDNDTTLGWYQRLDAATRGEVDLLAGTDQPMPWALIELVFRSSANMAIVPMQDFCGLGSAHRMNTPGIADGNWAWRLDGNRLTRDLAARIRGLLTETGRV